MGIILIHSFILMLGGKGKAHMNLERQSLCLNLHLWRTCFGTGPPQSLKQVNLRGMDSDIFSWEQSMWYWLISKQYLISTGSRGIVVVGKSTHSHQALHGSKQSRTPLIYKSAGPFLWGVSTCCSTWSASDAPNGWKGHTTSQRKHFSSATDSFRSPKRSSLWKSWRELNCPLVAWRNRER